MTAKEKIVNLLAKHGPFRDEDLARILDLSPSSVRTRRNELEKEGVVMAVGKTLTKYGRETYIWDIVK